MQGKLPNFLFIGPDKTGSTWIYEILKQHPQCFVPSVKDLYYFDRYYARGTTWYKRQFADAPVSARAIGELSHDYLFSESAAARIYLDLPGIRLITCLREPAERTFSHYLYLRRNGHTRLPLMSALEKFPELIDNSLYSRHLPNYLNRFPAADILVLNFADLRKDSREFAHQIFRFLGLDTPDNVTYDVAVLKAATARFWLLSRIAKTGANLAREMGFANLVGRMKSGMLRRVLYRTFPEGQRPTPSEAELEHLQQLFSGEEARVSRLLSEKGLRFSPW